MVGLVMKTKTPVLKTVPIHPILTVENLCVDYRNLRALENITLSFNPGSLTAIVGPNGGGKSTFLKTIAGQQKQDSGSIHFHSPEKTSIAYLPQSADIDRSFPISVGDVVAMGLCPSVGFFKSFSSQDRHKIQQALESVGLSDCIDRPIHCLSGGQFQRVLFARISLQNAQIILLDEPFAAIDGATMDILAGILTQWQSLGKTILTVLHDMEVVRDYFPSTLILARHTVAYGETKEVLTRENLRQAKLQCISWDIEPQTIKKPITMGA